MSRSIYRRLAKRRSLLSGQSLWLGPDHLLSVRSFRFTEEYRRFYFRDIQAITVHDYGLAHVVKWWDGLIVILLALLFYGIVHSWATAIFPTIVLGIYVALLIGRRTCDCSLYTAVSRERLRAISRRRTAERMLDLIRPLIEQAQADLPVAAPGQAQPEMPAPFVAPPFAPAPVEPAAPASYAFPLALFSLVLAGAALSLLIAFYPHPAWRYLSMILLVAESACAVGSLVPRRGIPLPLKIRVAVVASLFFIYVKFAGWYYALSFLTIIRSGGKSRMGAEILFSANYPGARTFETVSACVAAALALWGFLVIWQLSQRARAQLSTGSLSPT